MRVLHIGDEKVWRGGENQIRLFLEETKNFSQIKNFVAYPHDSEGLKRLASLAEASIGLPSSSPYDLRSVYSLVRFCQKQNIEILDAQSSAGLSLSLMVKRFLPRLKIIVHRRVDNPIKKNCFSRRKYLNPQVDTYIAVSSAIKTDLIEYGVCQNKIKIIYDSIRKQTPEWSKVSIQREIKAELGINENAFLIGNASAFTSQKAHDVLIKAFYHLLKSVDNCYLILPGDGPLLNFCKTIAVKLNVNNYVKFLGYRLDSMRWISSFDVLAVPSRNEGLGSVIQEGIHAGCAVVASRVGGIPEMIRHEKTGLLCEPENIQSLTESLLRLYKDKGLLETLKKNASEHLKKHFCLSTLVKKTLHVYSSVLS